MGKSTRALPLTQGKSEDISMIYGHFGREVSGMSACGYGYRNLRRGREFKFHIQGQRTEPSGGNIMKRALTALALAGTLAIATIATPTSAHAQWRRGWGWGLGGLAAGLFIGAALSRPYAYGYGYPAYSYGYGYPSYGYASYGYGYPSYGYASYGYGYPSYGYGYGGGYYRPAYRSAYYGGYRPVYRPAVYGGYRVARRVAIHRARWR
jgi:hypothetical protein